MNKYDALATITVALLGILTPLVGVIAKRLGKVEKSVNGHATAQTKLITELRADLKAARNIIHRTN